jgi:hypothetical protein
MKAFLSLCLLVLYTLTFMEPKAYAGYEGLNQGVSLKLFTGLDCGDGLSCARVKNKMVVTNVGSYGASSLQNRVLASATTLTAAQCGSTIYNAGAIEIELPEASAVLGCRFTFVTLNAANFDVDPDAADQILVQTDAAGDKIRNATLGNSVTIEAVSASQWAVVGILGTWSDAN